MPSLEKIADVLQGHQYETYVSSCCPFHDDSHPSFLVYEDRYMCMSCGASGNTEHLLDRIHGVFFPKNRERFVNPWNRWIKQDGSIPEVCMKAHYTLIQFPAQMTYMEKRGIVDAVERLKIGWIDGYYTFPIMDRNHKIIGGVCRSGDENAKVRYISPYGQRQMLYIPSHKRTARRDTIYVVYGIIDSISMYLDGYASLTGTTGKHLNPDLLSEYRKKIVILPDFGEEKEANQLAAHLGWRGTVKRLEYPEMCKDVNDLVTHGYSVRDMIQ